MMDLDVNRHVALISDAARLVPSQRANGIRVDLANPVQQGDDMSPVQVQNTLKLIARCAQRKPWRDRLSAQGHGQFHDLLRQGHNNVLREQGLREPTAPCSERVLEVVQRVATNPDLTCGQHCDIYNDVLRTSPFEGEISRGVTVDVLCTKIGEYTHAVEPYWDDHELETADPID